MTNPHGEPQPVCRNCKANLQKENWSYGFCGIECQDVHEQMLVALERSAESIESARKVQQKARFRKRLGLQRCRFLLRELKGLGKEWSIAASNNLGRVCLLVEIEEARVSGELFAARERLSVLQKDENFAIKSAIRAERLYERLKKAQDRRNP